MQGQKRTSSARPGMIIANCTQKCASIILFFQSSLMQTCLAYYLTQIYIFFLNFDRKNTINVSIVMTAKWKLANSEFDFISLMSKFTQVDMKAKLGFFVFCERQFRQDLNYFTNKNLFFFKLARIPILLQTAICRQLSVTAIYQLRKLFFFRQRIGKSYNVHRRR